MYTEALRPSCTLRYFESVHTKPLHQYNLGLREGFAWRAFSRYHHTSNLEKRDRMNMGSDRLHFTQKEEDE